MRGNCHGFGNWNRRGFLSLVTSLTAAGNVVADTVGDARRGLVPKADFPGICGITYLNSAQKHPLHRGAAQAIEDYAQHNLLRADGDFDGYNELSERVIAQFARLINASAYEIGFVPSTMTADHLDLPPPSAPGMTGNIVTDTLHYDGSLYLYDRLAARGVEVRRVRQSEGRINQQALARLIDKNTRLVALSLVSYANGFQHDLKSVCETAHANGALVYADIIQAAGAVPIDVRASRVDICAGSTHKWLMGDKGLGFLYIRRDLLDSGRIAGTQYGWKQVDEDDFSIFGPASDSSHRAHYRTRPGVAGAFEVGTYALGPMACAAESIAYIQSLGVDRIQAHANELAQRLRREMPRLDYELLSPLQAPGHISAFRVRNREMTAGRLSKAAVKVRFTQDFMRVSLSVFNDMSDVDALLNALS